VKKIMLVVTGNEGEVFLDEIGDGSDHNHWRHANDRDQLLALHSQINDRTGDRISTCIAVKIQLKTHAYPTRKYN
jgi:hypothetical protein